MKKIILAVILLAAAGGIAYYLLQNKKQNAGTSFKQEQVIGKWKLVQWNLSGDSINHRVKTINFLGNKLDFNFSDCDYDFKKDGSVIKFLRDSIAKDTSHYQWTKDNHILWKKKDDSVEQSLKITVLNKDSLGLQTKDSALLYFKKVK